MHNLAIAVVSKAVDVVPDENILENVSIFLFTLKSNFCVLISGILC